MIPGLSVKKTEEKTHIEEHQQIGVLEIESCTPIPRVFSSEGKGSFIPYPPSFILLSPLQPSQALNSQNHPNQIGVDCGFYRLWRLVPPPTPKHSGWAAVPLFLIGSFSLNQQIVPTLLCSFPLCKSSTAV